MRRTTKAEVLDIIVKHFPHQPTKDVAVMCGVSTGWVQQLAIRAGLRKTAAARAKAPYVGRERYWRT